MFIVCKKHSVLFHFEQNTLPRGLIIIIIQVIYIALFTEASQRLQFTNRKRKENTSKTLT